jgi:dTDP-4-dehydrorhamnose 3,5-epimerase-like enzyme
MHLFPLQRSGDALTLLREQDHLLRRFGQLDIQELATGKTTAAALRAEADRFLFVIAGAVKVTLRDERNESPSKGTRVEIELNAADPQGLLVPFGVACQATAQTDSRIVLMATHSEAHAADRSLGQI